MIHYEMRRQVRRQTPIRALIVSSALALTCALLAPSPSFAAPCSTSPAVVVGTFTGMRYVEQQINMLGAMSVGTVCTAVAGGIATACPVLSPSKAGAAVLVASLPGVGSCIWNCNTTGGTCDMTVDNADGLPVELLSFGVE